MRTRRLLPAALIFFAACVSPTRQEIPMPAADSAVGADVARVYVVRESLIIGSLREVRLYDDDKEIGALHPGGFICWDRPAARGVGRAVFSGYVLDGGPVDNYFDLPREGGTTSWFAIRLRRGDRKPVVEAVPPEEGRALVAERRPAKTP